MLNFLLFIFYGQAIVLALALSSILINWLRDSDGVIPTRRNSTGKVSSYITLPNFKEGFPLPVQMSLQLLDTVITIKGNNATVPFSSQFNLSGSHWDAEQKQNIRGKLAKPGVISADTSIGKLLVKPAHNYPSHFSGDNDADLLKQQLNASPFKAQKSPRIIYTDLIIKSTSPWHNFLFSLRSVIGLLVYIVIVFQLIRIITLIKKKVAFQRELFRRVNVIAISLIGLEFLRLVLSIVYGSLFGLIRWETVPTAAVEQVRLSFNPTLDFSFQNFLLGLLVLVLSYLIQKGIALQQEAEYTV